MCATGNVSATIINICQIFLPYTAYTVVPNEDSSIEAEVTKFYSGHACSDTCAAGRTFAVVCLCGHNSDTADRLQLFASKEVSMSENLIERN